MEGFNLGASNSIAENTCIKIYRTDDQKIIAVFPTYTKVARFLSVPYCRVAEMMRRKTKHLCKSLNTQVTIRFGNIDDLDQ